MKNNLNKSYVCLKPFRNGLSLFLGILFLGLISCSAATDYTSSSPTEDKTPPTVTISTNKSLEKDITGSITFTFTEEVNNFTLDDIQFNGVSVDKGNFVTNNLTNYSLEITPKAAGTLYVSIQANSFEDLSGNQNTDSFSNNFLVEDKTPPTVTISTNKSLEKDITGAITFTFSEEVNNFTLDDIQFNGVSVDKGNFVTNSLTNYSLEITPKAAGTLEVSIPANSFEDLSGNQNTDSFSNNFLVEDKTPPTVTISTNKSLEKDITGAITFTFSEEVNNFTLDDIQFNGVSVDKGNFVTNSLTNYSLEITPKAAGTLEVSIPANSFEDLSGNQNTDSFSNNFLVEDKTPPTVTISTNKSLEKDITGAITFTFSEEVNNFTLDDIQFNGVSVDKGNFVTNSLTNYSLEITPKAAGTLEVSIPANSFEDLSGNQNTDSFSNNFLVEDKTPPTVTISTNKFLKKDITGAITFTFSEEVNNFTLDDIQFNGVSVDKGNFVTNSLTNYSLEITPKAAGTLEVSIPANSFEDLSGNQNTDSFSNNFLVEDKTPPTVTISTNKSLEKDITGAITFTFSEEVNNFTLDDIQFNGVSVDKGNFVTNSLTNYSLEITPKAAGTLEVSIPANSFEDLSGNQNTDSFSNNFWVRENIPPTVTSINSKILIEGESASLSITFSEEVNNFTLDDIQFNGVSVDKGNFVTNSLTNYSLEITPKAAGTLEVSIPANSFEDLSANQNDETYSNSFRVFPSGTPIHTISFKLNGGSFISPQITTLKVPNNEAIEETQLEGILSYPPTGPKPSIQAVTRDIYEWRNNGTKYDLSTAVRSDLTLEALWANSCRKVETFHPANRNELQRHVDVAVGSNPTANLNYIDTSAITDMYALFYNKGSFNGKIGCWNTANVTNMRSMFQSAKAFNQDIGSWNVFKVTNMRSMFFYAKAFNQDIGSWNVGNVTTMGSMFGIADVFNQDIGSWNVANVTNMSSMFELTAFNRDISSWNVANVSTMRNMFRNTSAFNQNISNWNVSKVTTMENMFRNTSAFNQNISNWNVSKVTTMENMFRDASVFNQNIGTWDVSKVNYMSYMFYNASAFNQNLSSWSVTYVISYNNMFTGSAMESETAKHPSF